MLRAGIQEYQQGENAVGVGYQMVWKSSGFERDNFLRTVGGELLDAGCKKSSFGNGWESYTFIVQKGEVYLVVQIDAGLERKQRRIARRLFVQFPSGLVAVEELRRLVASFMEGKKPAHWQENWNLARRTTGSTERRVGFWHLAANDVSGARDVLLALGSAVGEGSRLIVALTGPDVVDSWEEISIRTLRDWSQVNKSVEEFDPDADDSANVATRDNHNCLRPELPRYSKYRLALEGLLNRDSKSEPGVASFGGQWVRMNEALLKMECPGWVDVLDHYGCLWLYYQLNLKGKGERFRSLLVVSKVGYHPEEDLGLLARFHSFCSKCPEFDDQGKANLRSFSKEIFLFVLSVVERGSEDEWLG